jgi:hypothetical protein
MTAAPAGVMPVAGCPQPPRGFSASGRQQCGGRAGVLEGRRSETTGDIHVGHGPCRLAPPETLRSYASYAADPPRRRRDAADATRCVESCQGLRSHHAVTPNLLAAQCDKSAGASGAVSPGIPTAGAAVHLNIPRQDRKPTQTHGTRTIPPIWCEQKRMPTKRIQLSRSRGWRIPPNTFKIDRSTRWGNPFRVGREELHPLTKEPIFVSSAEMAVGLFSAYLATSDGATIAQAARNELRGKNLACWCKLNNFCHGDVLLRIANGPAQPRRLTAIELR